MMRHRLPALVLVSSLTLLLGGCGKPGSDGAGTAQAAKGPATAKPLLLSAEDLQAMGLSSYASGPVITGSVQPEKRADLRAEVQAMVLQVFKENGEKVRRGDLLVRLDDSAIRETLSSAEQAARAAAQSFEQAERQFQRMKTLQAQGMSSMQAMEDAEIRRNSAQSELVEAKARAATARQQLQRTEARAPFDGIVSDRKVSAGDTAQIGKELVKVIDPSSMRFEGLVSADRMSELKVGQTVFFKVNGYTQSDFEGKVRRIAAAANPTTRQVEVLVDFVGEQQPGVAGLYAEGRVQSQSVSALMLADGAIQREGDQAYVWRVQDGKLSRVAVKLGERDERQGLFQVSVGLKPGDQVLRHPNNALSEGRAVEFAKPAAASASTNRGG
ncbi:efflux RND transporter periplasmic adaptor subunit [Paucibacter sp. PLA-PC-4]|uniref:efflux RND transporter periplasmic adaptor subunit n=1 Tax=Paucibacter sp. PLA-PC-4 TaxID=2993655 RepID=UPI002248CBB9|nr:efflux RND transporter periplasmic adaptor subunit [Paucibacter sp. PLA-PC-4]MCX2861815.1 efflux RND transporter periplasmic adaptor subunit [Paucibacter sp. PLA-PC-4]